MLDVRLRTPDILAQNNRSSVSRKRRQTSRPFIWISANCFRSRDGRAWPLKDKLRRNSRLLGPRRCADGGPLPPFPRSSRPPLGFGASDPSECLTIDIENRQGTERRVWLAPLPL